jgi:hypothetical protein
MASPTHVEPQLRMGLGFSKNELYRPSSAIRSQKFGPSSIRFPLDYVDRLVERDADYDPELNYALCILSGWSYSDGQTLANKLKYYGLQFSSVEEVTVVNEPMLIVSSAFLARSQNGKVGILSFRGTEPTNAINWLTDTDVILRSLGDGQVHRGFYTNVQAIWEEISDKLTTAMEPRSKGNGNGASADFAPMECLYITGHSLGAAMAVIAAAKIHSSGSPQLKRALRGIYTYGQPAVGDRSFSAQCSQWFGSRLYRHVFAFDAVARLPPSSTGKFVHFGVERVAANSSHSWMTRERAATQAPLVLAAIAISGLSFVVRRVPLLMKLKLHALLDYSIEDHSPTGYIEASRSSLIGRG